VAVADYDNDGFPDLYVSNYGPKVLYHNNGDGTFTDVTQLAGVADGNKVGAGAAFLDMDGNGNLDLYVASYVKFTYANHVARREQGYIQYVGPKDYQPEVHALFRNDGDGQFADVSRESGISQRPGSGMGIVCADYDRDGKTDIFVLNDVSSNHFWRNLGGGKFEEVGLLISAAYNGYGFPLGSMGIDCGDFDNDGWLDFYQTSYEGEFPILFRNMGNGMLEDATMTAGAGAGLLPSVKWGCAFTDFDNDGDRDLFVGVGHLQDSIERYNSSTSYRCRNVVLKNQLVETGRATFVNITDQAGDGLLPRHSARGVAVDDLDNDGRLDVVILNSREAPMILHNVTPGDNHWLQVQLRGVKTNRDGVGAQVKIVAGDLVQIDEVHSGRGYQSHFGSRLHFGLGKRGRVDRIEVRWIGGEVDILRDVPADRLLTITEGCSPADL
jgi:hypothetical protein